MDEPHPGILFLVVGPSGAGKDTLISGAKQALADNSRVFFPPRFITRVSEVDGEQHAEVSVEEFIDMEAKGVFALSWSAHGLRYGIPAEITEFLKQGISVVSNVSRSVIDQARSCFAHVHVLHITVSHDVLLTRLRKRGRESESDIAARVARADAYDPPGGDVTEIDNSGDAEKSIARFCDAIVDQLK